MLKATWNRIWPWLRRLGFLLAAAYFGQKLSGVWAEKQEIFSHFEGKSFLFSTFILAAVFPLLPIASKYTAELFHVHLPMKQSFQSYFYAQAGKYLPGGIWSYVGRVYLLHQSGIGKQTAFSMTLLELLLLGQSGSFCFLFSLFFWGSVPVYLWTLSIAACLAFSLFVSALFLIKSSSPFLKRLGLRFDLRFQPGKLGLILLIYLCFWEGVGIGFSGLIKALASFPADRVLVFAGIYPFAWIMGKLVFFMPAGIGVREGALVSLLVFF